MQSNYTDYYDVLPAAAGEVMQRNDLTVLAVAAAGTMIGAVFYKALVRGRSPGWKVFLPPAAGFALGSIYAPQQKGTAAFGAALPILW